MVMSSRKTTSSRLGLAERMKICMKRKVNLMKKSYELSTLCGIVSCMIFYGPDGNLLATWPENRREVKAVLERYNTLSSNDKEKRNLNLSSLFSETKQKKRLNFESKVNTNRLSRMHAEENSDSDSVYPTWDNRYDEFPVEKLRVMEGLLGSKLKKIREREGCFKFMKKNKKVMNNRNGLLPCSSYSRGDQFGGNPCSSTYYPVPANWVSSSSSSSSSSSMQPNYAMSTICNCPACVQKIQDYYDLPPSMMIPQHQPVLCYLLPVVPRAQPVHHYSFQPAQNFDQMQRYEMRDGGL